MLQELIGIYGSGKRQTVARWINMAKAPFSSNAAIMGFLREKPYWPHGYVCGNVHFDGSDNNQRLNEEYAMAALQLLNEALAKSKPVNVTSFIAEYCKPMWVAQCWEKGTLGKFGSNVGKLPIFQRVMRHLKTEGLVLVLGNIIILFWTCLFKVSTQWGGPLRRSPHTLLSHWPIDSNEPGGRQEILACAKSATPLHGKNGSQGVQECSQLVVELQKLRDAATAAATAATGRGLVQQHYLVYVASQDMTQ